MRGRLATVVTLDQNPMEIETPFESNRLRQQARCLNLTILDIGRRPLNQKGEARSNSWLGQNMYSVLGLLALGYCGFRVFVRIDKLNKEIRVGNFDFVDSLFS